jgi:hypothetical protein
MGLIYKLQDNIYDSVVYITWVLYFVIFFGLSTSAPQYLTTLQTYTKIYVSLFLVIRFNPLTRVRITPLDIKISFSAGLFLLTTTALDQIIKIYYEDLKDIKL